MKNPIQLKGRCGTLISGLTAGILLLFVLTGCEDNNDSVNSVPPTLSVSTVASGLAGPMGIAADSQGNLWVTESGTDTLGIGGSTHNNTGKVILITPDGNKYDAVINLASYANVHSGELQGTVHVLLDGNTLYILSGDYLYRADISNFGPGDPPMDANTLPSEDIASVISAISSPNNPENDSHPYNLTKGPNGDLYITDAGANAIVHRLGVGNYSILAELPLMANPAFPGLGGPTVQPVPTSILFDGTDFLVTTLTGFPFPSGSAVIYKVSMSGTVSVYQNGFTMLVDQAKGDPSRQLVVQYAASFDPASGFAPNSGTLIWANGTTRTVLADSLNQPVGIKQVNDHTWYVTSLGNGSVLKVTYQ